MNPLKLRNPLQAVSDPAELLWNPAPVSKSINSSRSDMLPPLEKYLESFIDMHDKKIILPPHRNCYPDVKSLEKIYELYRNTA